MVRHLAAALAAILLAWLAPAGDASAQACTTFPSGTGRDLFCRTTAQGGFDCDRSGCHAGASATNNVNKIHNAASWSAIVAAINGGVAQMNPGAAFNGRVMTDPEAESVAAFVASWFSTGAPPPSPAPTPTPPPPPPEPEPSPSPSPVPPPTSTIVEYFHAGFGHYFITGFAADIAALDSGRFAGWTRTGRSFNAYTSTNGYVTSVCRFFTVAFPPKSSHFYTSNSAECNSLQANNKDWTFEAEAFYVEQAGATTGSCPAGHRAVYRLYNNGQSGAPNHRYTTDPAIRADMMAKGWIPEGFGPEGVGFCAPN